MTWSIELLAKGSAVLLGAWGLAQCRSRLSASARDLIWTLAFAALILLPALTRVSPVWVGPLTVTVTPGEAEAVRLSGMSFDWLRWIWLAGLVVSLGTLAVSHLRALVMAKRSRPLEPVEGVAMRQTPPGTMPMTWGLFRPVIFMPADSAGWAEDLRDSVVRHELSHVRRADLWKQLLAQVACGVWWFHPLAWMASRHAAAAREEACDNEVLSQGAAGTTYAEHLIEVARGRVASAAAAGMPFGSQLEGRVLAILDDRARREKMKRNAIAAACLLTALFLFPFAGMTVFSVNAAEGEVVKPVAVKKVQPIYPPEARKLAVQGSVVLDVEVTGDGSTGGIVVAESVHPELDQAAIDAVRQWEFEPGTVDGKKVSVKTEIVINFTLK